MIAKVRREAVVTGFAFLDDGGKSRIDWQRIGPIEHFRRQWEHLVIGKMLSPADGERKPEGRFPQKLLQTRKGAMT